MQFGASDTPVEVARLQAQILSRRSDEERLRLVADLSAEVITRSQEAVRRSMPGADEDAVMTRWVLLHHGPQVAALLAEGRRSRSSGRASRFGSELTDVLIEVSNELQRLGVPHCECGSVAGFVRGVAHSTLDVDIAAKLNAEQARELVRSLAERYYGDDQAAMDAVRSGSSFNLIDSTRGVKVDIFAAGSDPLARSSINHASQDERGVPIASAEDLIAAKLRWFRKGGESSERQWNDVLGLLRVNGPQLDRGRLDRLAAVAEVEDLLARATNEA